MPGRRTSALFVALLVAGGLVIGLLVRPFADRLDRHAPLVGWGAAAGLFVIALVVGGLAWSTWQSLHKQERRISSDHALMLLATSKSCVIVGCLCIGGDGGYALAFLGDVDTPLGQDRALHSAFAAGAAVLVLVASLLLERACRLPEDDDENGNKGRSAPDATPA
jgi:MFS family permease